MPSPQKIVLSPRKFTEDPLWDVQEPSERSRHTCGTSLESSMLYALIRSSTWAIQRSSKWSLLVFRRTIHAIRGTDTGLPHSDASARRPPEPAKRATVVSE